MDRLIWYDNDGRIMCRRGYEVALARLASYEATGLTPEQVANAKTIIESAFADDTSKAERIRKLLVADDEGRVIVLPCKVGSKVYRIRYRIVDYPDEPEAEIMEAEFVEGYRKDFGKTVFLTREEAERSLEEQKNV